MEVSFVKQGAIYVAEFEVPGDFNLHLERKKSGIIRIYQRGSSQGEYDLSYTSLADDVFDHDFGALVYPKWIKVESSSEVVSASVNFNVGGGSGSGESGEASTIEYLDVSNLPEELNITEILALSSAVKYYDGGDNLTIGTLFINNQDMAYNGLENIFNKTVAVKVNWDEPVYVGWKGYGILTLKEFIGKEYDSSDYFNTLPRITKEQFYSLE